MNSGGQIEMNSLDSCKINGGLFNKQLLNFLRSENLIPIEFSFAGITAKRFYREPSSNDTIYKSDIDGMNKQAYVIFKAKLQLKKNELKAQAKQSIDQSVIQATNGRYYFRKLHIDNSNNKAVHVSEHNTKIYGESMLLIRFSGESDEIKKMINSFKFIGRQNIETHSEVKDSHEVLTFELLITDIDIYDKILYILQKHHFVFSQINNLQQEETVQSQPGNKTEFTTTSKINYRPG